MSAVIDIEHQDAVAMQQAIRQSALAITGHATIGSATHDQFVRSEANVRRKPRDIRELTALIRSQGLLHNLVCYAQVCDGVATGKLVLAAGDGRWRALGALIEEGSIPADYQILYLLVTEAEALMVSLAENLGRELLHAADVFDGMLGLARQGRSIADIALSFGCDELTVRRRLKLANVAPRLFALYRDDKISYEHMVAFACTDDHAAQLQAWDSLDAWSRTPQHIKRLLTAQQIDAQTDRVARYVGLKAYRAAGGEVIGDLFSEHGGGYIENLGLLEQLARGKLQRVEKGLACEGWSWTEVHLRVDTAELASYAKVRTAQLPPSAAQQAALAQLAAREAALVEREANGEAGGGGGDVGEEDDDIEAAQTRIDDERAAIHAALRRPDAADLALAGALVTLDADGKPCVLRGLIRPQDKHHMARQDSRDALKPAKARPVHSERLTTLLTAQRTLALGAEMVRQPQAALLLLAQRLLHAAFYRAERRTDVLQLALGEVCLPKEAQVGPAWEALEAQRAALLRVLPDSDRHGELLAWLRQQPPQLVLDCIVFCSACATDALHTNETAACAFEQAAQLLELDMHRWWQPTAPAYFAHVNKRRMAEVVAQAVSPTAAVPLERLDKAGAIAAAARAVADSGWLPDLLCVAPARAAAA